MGQQRILVVDDDKSIARLVRDYLKEASYEVLLAHTGEEALHMVRREKPDLLILDLMLPDRDGWEITRQIRADQYLAPLPIIMLTARVEDTDKIIGLELGADDYITKPFNTREIVARVRSLLRRANFAQNNSLPILRVGGLTLDLDQHLVTVNDVVIDLTPTEFTILQVLVANPGHTFTRKELLEKSLGYAYEGMARTLDTHMRNLRKKIEPDPSTPIYIQTVYGIGYRLTGDDS